MSDKRKQVSKRVRFEVFKRDSFKCQYCGKSSPDVVLHVDHIKPVSKGGDNSIMNLVTACQGCNLGKSNIELDDGTAIAKQKQQLDELNDKREQLELMIDWRASLREIDDTATYALMDEIDQKMLGRSVNENGVSVIRKWLKAYSYADLSECIESSASQYLKFDDEGDSTEESSVKFFEMIPRIARVRQSGGNTPEMTRLYYARGILRNRFRPIDEQKAIRLLILANSKTHDTEWLVDLAKSAASWKEFQKEILGVINSDIPEEDQF